MADLTITASAITPGANAVIDRQRFAGAAITAGKAVYKETGTNLIKLADSNGASANIKTPYGIALHAAEIGQPIAVQTHGKLNMGAILTAGDPYYLSETPGGIQPAADVGTGENIAQLGLAISASVLDIDITIPGVTHA